MRRSFLCTIVFAAACLLLSAQETQAQYAYGASGIGYDPNTKIVYGYSRTSVDAWAGSYYDPYVEGFLFDPYNLRDWGYSRGYMHYYAAVVETASFTAPRTRYDVESDHYVISWYSVSVTVCDYYGFYGGCGYDPYGFSNFFGGYYGGFNYFGGGYGGYVPERTYYLGTTGISGITPAECSGEEAMSYAMTAEGSGEPTASSSSGTVTNYEATSSTTRDYVELNAATTCAIIPQVKIKSVGFKGDMEVRQFVNGDANDPVIAPGDAPTWVKDRSGNDKNVVAYVKGQSPTIFATLTVSSADPAASATLRVRHGSTVLATMPIDVTANRDVTFDNIQLPAQLGEAALARERNYDFKWEVTFNNKDWKSAGESGGHKVYWTLANPIGTAADPIFKNIVGTGYTPLYDIALEKSVGKLGDGTADATEAVKKITNGVASDLIYNPGRKSDTQQGGKHPLEVYKRGTKDFQCDDNAFLLRGLLRSAGTDGTVKYYYGGAPATDKAHFYIPPGGSPGEFPEKSPFTTGETVTARFDRPALTFPPENVAEDPHFSFHATVAASGADSYDPSYGSAAGSNSQPVKILQAVKSDGRCVTGTEADTSWKITTGVRRPGSHNGLPFGRACGSFAGGGTGIPRAASVVAQSVPTYMEAGSASLVSVTLQNNGDNTWSDADLYKLGAQNPQDNWTWGFNRTPLPRSVAPGEQVTLDFYVYAPSSTGYYDFQWRMVQDGVEWFGDYTPNVMVNVYSLYTCDPWQEQDCWNRGGSWDSSSCYCYGGYIYNNY